MGWDRGVEFEEAKRRLERLIQRTREGSKSRCYAYILYVQLFNGSRISEAIRACDYFSSHAKAEEANVTLSKSKNARKRLMAKPENLDLTPCRKVYKELLSMGMREAVKRLSDYAVKRLGMNTHSLRYAFITHMLTQRVSVPLVARIVGHRKLDHILTYAQEVAARRLLVDFVKEST